jgi:hypothetical protein
MVMKVIFLDNDGVICLSDNWGSRFKKQNKWGGRKLSMSMSSIPIEYRFDNFDVKAVKILNEILEETDAEIVVSSDWQNFATLDELGEYYESQGIIKKPIGVTKEIGGIDFKKYDKMPWNRDLDLEQHRSLEILEWLEAHTEVTHWVAVDDLHMGIHVENSWRGAYDREDWGLENFVWTPRDNQGIKQSGIKDKILKFLL